MERRIVERTYAMTHDVSSQPQAPSPPNLDASLVPNIKVSVIITIMEVVYQSGS